MSSLLKQYLAASNLSKLNKIQEKVAQTIFNTNSSITVSAPTGSGKSVILELAIIKKLEEADEEFGLVVYLSPYKSLCAEIRKNLSQKFSSFGLSIIESTGDTSVSTLAECQNHQVVISTPEKFDFLIRNDEKNCKKILSGIRLVLIDEIQLIGDIERGAILENLLTTFKLVSKKCRFVAISATLTNIRDISEWLCDSTGQGVSFKFGDEHRQTRIEKIVMPFYKNPQQSYFQYENNLSFKIPEIISRFAQVKQTLIFCHTRKSCEQTADVLYKSLNADFINDPASITSVSIEMQSSSPKLSNYLLKGIAYHHAGLSLNNRRNIETLFLNGSLPILICTSTLAVGVNFPAQLVIIKGTQQFRQGVFESYTSTQITQMVGRAGRLQYNDSGIAVIMTTPEMVAYYKNMNSLDQIIESTIHLSLVENIIWQFSLGCAHDFDSLFSWAKKTFLYLRIYANPVYYNFSQNSTNLDEQMNSLLRTNLEKMQSNQLISQREVFSCEYLGKLMFKYSLKLSTIEMIRDFKGDKSILELIVFISSTPEFDQLVNRISDRTALRKLNRPGGIKFPYKRNQAISSHEIKAVSLIQAVLDPNIQLDDGLFLEADKIYTTAQRISNALMCLLDFIDCEQDYNSIEIDLAKNYLSSLNIIRLNRSMQLKMWHDCPGAIIHQLPCLGNEANTIAKILNGYHIFTKKQILSSGANRLSQILQKPNSFVNMFLDDVTNFPSYRLDVQLIEQKDNIESSTCLFELSVTIDPAIMKNAADCVFLLVGETKMNVVLFRRTINIPVLSKEREYTSRFNVNSINQSTELEITLLSKYFIGIDLSTKFKPNDYLKIAEPIRDVSMVTTKRKTPLKNSRNIKKYCLQSEIEFKQNNNNRKAPKTVQTTITKFLTPIVRDPSRNSSSILKSDKDHSFEEARSSIKLEPNINYSKITEKEISVEELIPVCCSTLSSQEFRFNSKLLNSSQNKRESLSSNDSEDDLLSTIDLDVSIPKQSGQNLITPAQNLIHEVCFEKPTNQLDSFNLNDIVNSDSNNDLKLHFLKTQTNIAQPDNFLDRKTVFEIAPFEQTFDHSFSQSVCSIKIPDGFEDDLDRTWADINDDPDSITLSDSFNSEALESLKTNPKLIETSEKNQLSDLTNNGDFFKPSNTSTTFKTLGTYKKLAYSKPNLTLNQEQNSQKELIMQNNNTLKSKFYSNCKSSLNIKRLHSSSCAQSSQNVAGSIFMSPSLESMETPRQTPHDHYIISPNKIPKTLNKIRPVFGVGSEFIFNRTSSKNTSIQSGLAVSVWEELDLYINLYNIFERLDCEIDEVGPFLMIPFTPVINIDPQNDSLQYETSSPTGLKNSALLAVSCHLFTSTPIGHNLGVSFNQAVSKISDNCSKMEFSVNSDGVQEE